MTDEPSPGLPHSDHDHSKCVEIVITNAEESATRSGTDLVGLPLDVLKELISGHRAHGAYEILDRLASTGRKLQAVQIYRALDKLAELNLVHRVESDNAYFACMNGPGCEAAMMLICDNCHTVAEQDSHPVHLAIADAALQSEFKLRHAHVELRGLCAACRKRRGVTAKSRLTAAPSK